MPTSKLFWSGVVVFVFGAVAIGRANALVNAGFDIECAFEGWSQKAGPMATAAVTTPNAKAKGNCKFKGDYSFFFWDPDQEVNVTGVGYVSASCNGQVLPGGIIDCNFGGGVGFESFIEGGNIFLERDGEGTMLIETNSSDGICGTGKNAIELDISVVKGGKSVLFNTDGAEKGGSGAIPQAGYDYTLTGRADKCFAGQISGCYDMRFWGPDNVFVGDCTVCVDGKGHVTGGTCRCHGDHLETLSEIITGGYTLGEDCQSSTGYLWLTTSSDLICGDSASVALDFE